MGIKSSLPQSSQERIARMFDRIQRFCQPDQAPARACTAEQLRQITAWNQAGGICDQAEMADVLSADQCRVLHEHLTRFTALSRRGQRTVGELVNYLFCLRSRQRFGLATGNWPSESQTTSSGRERLGYLVS